ncbi:hypothetical protein TSMG0152 [Halocynthia phage JM-2012]|uniref:hypothetical protein n=1 Tax=Halocynthia phage JM-2012 TaxID=1173297 RepID=UPI00025C6974|nr:hypothetical protein TSMG0152 [Halocynthia phage JM-2012]AFI55435.1 hypothetical protein TSMG0152 [Halocynthia phage JM-2012]
MLEEFNMFGENNYSSFTAERMLIGISGQYHDVVARPFTMHTSESSLDELMLKTNNGLNITQDSVQLENQSIIQLMGESQGVIDIDDTWQAGRNVFILILRNINDNSKFILSGFTSSDFLEGQNVNQYAQLRFNSMIELNAIQNMDGSISYQMFNSDNILTSNHLTGSVGGNITQPQRPTDVIDNAILRMETIDQSSSNIGSDVPVISMGLNNGHRAPELGRATNASGNDYLYRTARAFSDAQLTGTNQDDLTHHLQGMSSHSVLTEGSYSSTPLINSILTNAASRRTAAATFAELCEALPNLSQVTEILNGDGGATMEGMEHWKGRGVTTLCAEFAAAIPAVMMKLGISTVGFTMTTGSSTLSMDGFNNTFAFKHGSMGIELSFLTPEIPQMEAQAAFTAYLRNVVFPSITKHHNVVLDVQCSISKDMIISMSVDGSNPRTWAGPTFCSSLWNPTGATTVDSNTAMANGMMSLTNHISNSQNGMASNGTGMSSGMGMAEAIGSGIEDLF